jgi:hypothetical protein
MYKNIVEIFCGDLNALYLDGRLILTPFTDRQRTVLIEGGQPKWPAFEVDRAWLTSNENEYPFNLCDCKLVSASGKPVTIVSGLRLQPLEGNIDPDLVETKQLMRPFIEISEPEFMALATTPNCYFQTDDTRVMTFGSSENRYVLIPLNIVAAANILANQSH